MNALSGLPEPFHGDKDCDPSNCEMPELKLALSIPMAAPGRLPRKAVLKFILGV